MAYTVKAVAEMAGVSVRTLHHYDEIDLLKPEQLSAAGYRLYNEKDLERLQQILFFRELEFSLSDIREIIDDPKFDRQQALLLQKEALLERQHRLSRLIMTIDRTLRMMEGNEPMNDQELKELFNGFDQSQYEEEVKERFGQTNEYAESHRRTKQYTKTDWVQMQQEGGEIQQGIVALMDRDPADPEVQAWIGKHHQQINKWFYTCSLEIYRGLGEMYVADERFAANYEKIKPGLAAFMRAAMLAYCDQQESK